jgi:hypothetical protein
MSSGQSGPPIWSRITQQVGPADILRPKFSIMSRSTPCPELAQLRLAFQMPAPSPEADFVRAHLAQCEVCRAIVAGFEVEDGDSNTLANESVFPAWRGTSSADTMQVVRRSEIAAGHVGGDTTPYTLADGATMDAARAVSPRADASAASLVSKGMTVTSTSDATVLLTAAVSEDDGFHLSSSLQVGNATETSDSSETCCLLAGQDSEQPGASDSQFTPTQRGIPNRLLPTTGTLTGVTVPGYDILEELGRGGMGVVYKARHRRLQRLVALKMVLAGAHVGQVGLARFRAEAEAVAKLLHPNIVQIFETGEYEGRPFFSLEYVEGGSLDQRIGKSPTSPRGAAQFVETLARTMDVAHQRGIVHRDLKPANILLAKLGSHRARAGPATPVGATRSV